MMCLLPAGKRAGRTAAKQTGSVGLDLNNNNLTHGTFAMKHTRILSPIERYYVSCDLAFSDYTPV